ncbi:MAG: hypothetical protein ACR2FQ_04230 [Pseudonocardiaceae bacterium]
MTSAPPSGRLTLSWVGKDRALLGTAGGGYEWVERDDPRVAEMPFGQRAGGRFPMTSAAIRSASGHGGVPS